jgi:hypothetical protein
MIPRRTCALPVILLLAGCAATGAPMTGPAVPSPVIVTGPVGGPSATFSLAAGDYSVDWRVMQPDCTDVFITLIGLDRGVGWQARIVNGAAPGAMTSPAPASALTGVPRGSYVIHALTPCSWSVEMTQIR